MRISNIVTVFLSTAFLFSFSAESSVFNFEITNHLKSTVKLSQVSPEATADFESCGKVVIQPSSEKVLPKIDLNNVSTVSIATKQVKNVTAKITEIDFSSVGLFTGKSVVQRIQIVDTGSEAIAGYLSFRCSVYNTNPIVTMESCSGYKIVEENCPFGGGGIYISIKEDL